MLITFLLPVNFLILAGLDAHNCLFQRFSHLAYLPPDFHEQPDEWASAATDSLKNGSASWREFCGYESVAISNLQLPYGELSGPVKSRPDRKETGDGDLRLVLVPLDVDDYLRPSAVWVGMNRGMFLLLLL